LSKQKENYETRIKELQTHLAEITEQKDQLDDELAEMEQTLEKKNIHKIIRG